MSSNKGSRLCFFTYHEDGTADLIPGCMGAAIGGPEACTCKHPKSEIEALREEVSALQSAITAKERMIAGLKDYVEREAARGRDLRRRLDQYEPRARIEIEES